MGLMAAPALVQLIPTSRTASAWTVCGSFPKQTCIGVNILNLFIYLFIIIQFLIVCQNGPVFIYSFFFFFGRTLF